MFSENMKNLLLFLTLVFYCSQSWGYYWIGNVTPPSDMSIEYYTNGSRYIKVGVVNDTIYFGGLITNSYSKDSNLYQSWTRKSVMSWIYGTIQDSVITLTKNPVGEYFNIYDPEVYSFPVYIYPLEESDGNKDITLEIDKISKKIGHLNQPFIVSPSETKPQWFNEGILDKKKRINLERFPDAPQTPRAPVMTRGEFSVFSNKIFPGCYLEADIFSTDNHMMPASALYYKLYADGGPIDEKKDLIFFYVSGNDWLTSSFDGMRGSYIYRNIFLAHGYQINARYGDDDSTPPSLTKVFIPFSYEGDEYDYDSICEDYNTLYATLVLINPDGTVTESEPAYLQEGGIGGTVDDAYIKEQPVYDLTGRRVNRDNLAPGIYISAGRKFTVK